MTELDLRQKVVNIMRGWVGCVQGNATHRFIIDTYNSIRPLPRGLKMGYSSAWCAAAVSAAGFLAGMQEIIFPDINCGVMVEKYQAAGRWVEDDAYVPAAEGGDLVIYYWGDDGKDDCKEHESHVGMVVAREGNTFKVVEGNMVSGGVHFCGIRTMQVDGRYIRGFCVPDYKKFLEEHYMYHTLKDVPDWAKEAVKELIDADVLHGTKEKDGELVLDLTYSECRCIVFIVGYVKKALADVSGVTAKDVVKEIAEKFGF